VGSKTGTRDGAGRARLSVLACLVAFCLLVWFGPASSVEAGPCRAWRQVPPGPVEPGTALEDVHGTSATDVWAVGGNGINPVIEHFDGVAWSVVPSPSVRASLSGVRAFASDDAWAVGTGGLVGEAFAEHWDGTEWKVVEVPQLGTYSALYGIDGTSGSDVWAAGYYFTDQGIKALAEHWDGTAWTVVPMDDVSPLLNIMHSVEAIAPDDVWAVGYQEITFDVNQPLAEHWDGTAWTAVPVDPPPPANANSFLDVSASSSTDVWTVGTYGDSFPLMEHWDGTAWKRYPAPVHHIAWGVAAISPTNAWVGGSGEFRATSWHWNGGAWSVAGTPKVTPAAAVIADLVALSDRDIWAVGTYNPPQGGGLLPLILHSNGKCR